MRKIFITILFSISIGLMAHDKMPMSLLRIDFTQQATKSRLYPNPAKDFTIIKNYSETRISNISVLSMVGSSLINKEISEKKDHHEINVAKLPTGKYFVRISYINGNQEILTLIKQ